jgi:hypothetical protein
MRGGRRLVRVAPLSRVPKGQRQELLDDLNYLNLVEIKSFCKRNSIPYRITIEGKDGNRKATSEDDRKGVVLKRVRHFLRTGVVLKETCFAASVVSGEPLRGKIAADDKLFYGRYDKTNREMIGLLKELTDGQFRNGAIARILAREFWTRGKAPTFREFAEAWLKATKEHNKPNPEWAFLSDRAKKADTSDWKRLRARKAAKVMKILKRVSDREAFGEQD